MPLPLPGDGRCSVVASVWRGVREDRHRSLSQWLNDEIDCAENGSVGHRSSPKSLNWREPCTQRSPERSAFYSADSVHSSKKRRSTPSALKTRLSQRFRTKRVGTSCGTFRAFSALSVLSVST